MPFFNGQNIFGVAVSMQTVDNPRATQLNAFFGLDGNEALDGGARGRYTLVTGWLFGQGPDGLLGAENAFRLYKNGLAYTLGDTLGMNWSNCRLESFAPSGRVVQDSFGNYLRSYEARFHHLTDF